MAWCLSKRESIERAIADLRSREGTTNENIGYVRIAEQPHEIEDSIVDWARKTKLDAVVWTALKSNFREEVILPS